MVCLRHGGLRLPSRWVSEYTHTHTRIHTHTPNPLRRASSSWPLPSPLPPNSSSLPPQLSLRTPLLLSVDPDDPDTLSLLKDIDASPACRLAGIYTHGGHSYGETGVEAVQRVRVVNAKRIVEDETSREKQ